MQNMKALAGQRTLACCTDVLDIQMWSLKPRCAVMHGTLKWLMGSQFHDGADAADKSAVFSAQLDVKQLGVRMSFQLVQSAQGRS